MDAHKGCIGKNGRGAASREREGEVERGRAGGATSASAACRVVSKRLPPRSLTHSTRRRRRHIVLVEDRYPMAYFTTARKPNYSSFRAVP